MGNLAVILLAGGNSSRFGKPKPFLEFNDGTTFLERLVNAYSDFYCNKLVLVLNHNYTPDYDSIYSDSFKRKIILIKNKKPQLGRFYSLKLGADALDDTEYCFLQNIDNPFTDAITLQKLYASREDNSYVSPVYFFKSGHPVLISGKIIQSIKKENKIDLNIKEYLNKFNKISVQIDNDKILANINTPEDYDLYFK